MNWDHRFNSLTKGFLYDLEQAVRYLEMDPDMKGILLGDTKESNFSMGTDLDFIAWCSNSKNLGPIYDYFV